MSEFDALRKALLKFRDERDWEQFHDSKNLASAIGIEAAELNELFLWKNSKEDIESVDKERISEELADIFSFAILLAEKHDLDIAEIVQNKIKKNSEKYPVEKAKGSAKKYTEL